MTEEPLVLAVSFLLVTALSLYVLFGGADFGGGILEVTLPSPLQKKLRATMAPIWEANHVWLIAVVVLLFVGLPRFYATAMTRFYVPMSLALLSILIRGVFFTVSKYDPQPGRWRPTYDRLFRASSFSAPLCFGFILGGLLTVHPGDPFQLPSGVSFSTIYVAPWLHPFGLLCGLFVAALFGYLAAVFFFGELETPEERRLVQRRATQFFAATFFLGGIVLGWGALSGRVPSKHALSPFFLLCQVTAGGSIFLVRTALKRNQPWRARLTAGAQVLAVLGGWLSAQYPVLLRTAGGPLDLRDAAAPAVTLLWLTIGFSLVLSLVLPLLVLLYRVFRAPN